MAKHGLKSMTDLMIKVSDVGFDICPVDFRCFETFLTRVYERFDEKGQYVKMIMIRLITQILTYFLLMFVALD